MRRKLANFGLAFALAELAAAYLPSLAVVLTAAFLVLLLICFRRSSKRVMLLGAAAGLAVYLGYNALVVQQAQKWAGQTQTCVAVVETDCAESYQKGMLYGTIHIEKIGEKKVDLRAYCSVIPATEAGERISGKFSLSIPEKDVYRNGRYARGIYLAAEYQEEAAYLGRSSAPRFLLYRLRQRLAEELHRYIPVKLASVEAAMLLGSKKEVDAVIQKQFRMAGASHLLAVSGLHVALVCGVLGAGRRQRRFWRPGIAAQGVMAVLYVLLVGAPVSAVRAGGVFFLMLVGDFFLQPSDMLTLTGAVAVVMGLCNAYAPCDVGFQLSFSAMLGVAAAGALSRWERKMLETQLKPLNPEETEKETDDAAESEENEATFDAQTAKAYLLDKLLLLLDMMQSAAMAGAATAPVLLLHNMTTSGVGVLCSVLVVWMLRPALLLGLLVLLLSMLPLLEPAMHMASLLLAVWLKWMTAVVAWCASLPLAKMNLPRWYTLFVLLVLALLTRWFLRTQRFKLYPVALAACAAFAVVLGIRLQRDVVRVAMVGTSGNACVVVTQNGSAAVLFRGGAANLREVETYLEEHGGATLQTVIDLRQNPQELPFDAETVLSVQNCPEELLVQPVAFLNDFSAELFHSGKGNLAILDVGGYHIAGMAGKFALSEPITVDVFCAAGAISESIQADRIIVTSKKATWLDTITPGKLLYGADTPCIVLRPGKSVYFEGVTSHVLQ